ESWAEKEFGDADLGDPRRTKRLVRLAASMAIHPDGCVTGVVKSAAEREAAFRLLRNPAINEADIAASSQLATIGRLAPGEILIVAGDQTGLSVTDVKNSKGFGPAGSNAHEIVRGLQVMTGLAVGLDGGCIGICAQKWWQRS